MKTYSTFAIARMLQVDPGSVANWIDHGVLKAHRTPGRHRRVVESDLYEFLIRQQMPVPSQLAPGPVRVLIVDSEPAVTAAIREAIQSSRPDCEVVEANDGFRAGSLLAERKPSILILDMKMPGLDGFDICRLLKSQPETSDIKILAMSSRTEHRKEILACGAKACLSKPVDMAAVVRQVQSML